MYRVRQQAAEEERRIKAKAWLEAYIGYLQVAVSVRKTGYVRSMPSLQIVEDRKKHQASKKFAKKATWL